MRALALALLVTLAGCYDWSQLDNASSDGATLGDGATLDDGATLGDGAIGSPDRRNPAVDGTVDATGAPDGTVDATVDAAVDGTAIDQLMTLDQVMTVDRVMTNDQLLPTDATAAPDLTPSLDATVPLDASPMPDATVLADGACALMLCNGVCQQCCVNTDCPSVGSGGTDGCTSGVCKISCFNGFHECNQTCVSNNDPNHCGTTACTPCSTVANATATCPSGACVYTCNSGYVKDTGGACTPMPPRPLAPLSTATSSTGNPVFTWQLAAGTDGAHIDVCADRMCNSLDAAGDVTGSSWSPGFDLQPGVHYWRLFGRVGAATGTVPSPVWQLVTPFRDAAHGSSGGTIADWNADGAGDAVVGTSIDRAYVYLASGGAISTTAQLMLANSAITYYGENVGSAGDIDGDGYPDLVVSGGGSQFGGSLELYRGGMSGVAGGATSTISLITSRVAGVGDVNGDGYADLALIQPLSYAATVFYGSPTGITTTATATLPLSNPTSGNNFNTGTPSYGIAGGDINGDGFADVVASEWWYDGQTFRGYGAASIFLGSANGIATTAAATLSGDITTGFGKAVTVADFSGDGYADLVVAAPGTYLTGNDAIYIYVSKGASGIADKASPDYAIQGASSAGFGTSVASAGDMNRDGYLDLAVGAPGSGNVYLYAGTATGPSTTANPVAYPASGGGSGANASFGVWVHGAGDVNHDGYADVLVGASTASVTSSCANGAIFVVTGGAATAPTLSHGDGGNVPGPTIMMSGCVSTGFGITAE